MLLGVAAVLSPGPRDRFALAAAIVIVLAWLVPWMR